MLLSSSSDPWICDVAANIYSFAGDTNIQLVMGVGHDGATAGSGMASLRAYGNGGIDGLLNGSASWNVYAGGTLAYDGQDWARIAILGSTAIWWTGRGTALTNVVWTLRSSAVISAGSAPTAGPTTRARVVFEIDVQSSGQSATRTGVVKSVKWSTLGGL